MFDILKNLSKNSRETSDINKLVAKFPQNEVICKEVLKDIRNDNNINIQVEEEFNGNYYNAMNNTITLSGKEKQQSHISRIMAVCHECIHTTQNKLLHIFNYIFSNLELIAFLIALILLIILKGNKVVAVVYYTICIISITIRMILEGGAIQKAVPLSEKYMKKYLNSAEVKLIISRYKIMRNLTLIPFIISLFGGRLLRLLIIVLTTIFT